MKSKLVLFTVALSVLSACACKSKNNSTANSNETVDNEYTKAKITTAFAEEGCPVLVELTENGEIVYYAPIELADEYKKEGMLVKIKYTRSRAPQTTCFKGSPIVIDDIKPAE
jgi:ABC-type Fe3+-citrate transport system substrate-binding protein